MFIIEENYWVKPQKEGRGILAGHVCHCYERVPWDDRTPLLPGVRYCLGCGGPAARTLEEGGGEGSLTVNCIVCVFRSCLGAQRRAFPAIHWGRVVTQETR